MSEGFDYDRAIQLLRRSLIETAGNAQAFAIRARGRPKLVSARNWAELAEIEARLARDLDDTIRLELRVGGFTFIGRALAFYRGIWLGLQSETWVVNKLFRDAAEHPIEQWREASPQLEASLWPFFVKRTHHLANTLALALDEPSPYPIIFWHPGRHEFQN